MPRGHLNNSCFGHLRPVLFGVKASAPRATYLPGVSESIVTRSTYVKRTPSLMPSCVNRTKTSYIRGPGFFVTPSAPTCSQNIGRTRGQTPPPCRGPRALVEFSCHCKRLAHLLARAAGVGLLAREPRPVGALCSQERQRDRSRQAPLRPLPNVASHVRQTTALHGHSYLRPYKTPRATELTDLPRGWPSRPSSCHHPTAR